MSDCIRVGLFGLGTVGTGVIQLLEQNRTIIKKRTGKEIRIVKAVDLDLTRDRGVDLSSIDLSTKKEHILDDSEIDIVIELIGGMTHAEKIILEALEKGKSVVTANKALLAEHDKTIFPAAYKAKGCFNFEASVGGGIPIIRSMREGFSGDEIEEISGIINGTANYILSSMTEKPVEFADVLKDAQDKGFAEADPTFDIEGNDTAHKLIILMNLAFNGVFDYEKLHIEGITGITSKDIEYAKELGYRIKLLGKTKKTKAGVEGRVHPALIREDSMLASVNGAFNAVSVVGNFLGPALLYGLGAGSHPTASAVVSDIIEASRFIINKQETPLPPFSAPVEQIEEMEMIPMEQISTEYYLRFNVFDQVGVLAKITSILGENNISIRSMIQKSNDQDIKAPVDIVIVTHEAVELNIQKALSAIDKMAFVNEKTQLIRID